MKQTIPTLLLAASLCLFTPLPTPAQDAPTGMTHALNQDAPTETQTKTGPRLGFYLSTDLGANLAQSMETKLKSRPLERLYKLKNRFGQVQGFLSGAGFGYRFRPPVWLADDQDVGKYWGAELEYFYRTKHSQTSDRSLISGDDRDNSMAVEERIGRLDSHNLFLNFYLTPSLLFANRFKDTFQDIVGDPSALFSEPVKNALRDIPWPSKLRLDPKKIIPYSGVGFGLSFINMDYENRSMDPTSINATDTLEDMLFGYQALFGLDYLLRDQVSLGVKGRWISFYSFGDGGIWNGSNSDRSNGDDSYRLKTEDLDMFGVSISIKYHF